MCWRCIDRMAIDPNYPYSLGARCINKDWFGMPMDDVWKIMEENLHFCAHAFEIKIYLFVLMSNHYHMIASAPLGNLSACMQYLQASSSRQITKSAGRINHTWRAKFFRSLIGSHHYYLNAYKYFYRNPIAAGLCDRVEDYRYSTLNGLLGRSHLFIPVVEDLTLFSDVDGTIKWLNTKPKDGHSELMRKGLRRQIFKLPRDPKTGGKSELET
jgi:putative transposase